MPVSKSSLFIGEYVFGATAGAPLVVNNNQLANGLTNTEVNSSSAISVTTTNGVIGSATTTPAAGAYLVMASVNISASSAAGNILTIELYVGGTGLADTIRKAMPISTAALATFQNMSIVTNKIVTVNGSQAIALQAVSSAGTVTVTGLNFDVVRIS